uniref:BEN domain-containing protein n=1 Tax=Trichogramma kaykai TaxID=54128 RepID=A0ABD2W9M3_9HYME
MEKEQFSDKVKNIEDNSAEAQNNDKINVDTDIHKNTEINKITVTKDNYDAESKENYDVKKDLKKKEDKKKVKQMKPLKEKNNISNTDKKEESSIKKSTKKNPKKKNTKSNDSLNDTILKQNATSEVKIKEKVVLKDVEKKNETIKETKAEDNLNLDVRTTEESSIQNSRKRSAGELSEIPQTKIMKMSSNSETQLELAEKSIVSVNTKELIHCGNKIYIPTTAYYNAINKAAKAKNPSSMFVKEIAVAIIGIETLKTSNPTGRTCNRTTKKKLSQGIEVIPKKKIDEALMGAVVGIFQHYLAEVRKMDPVTAHHELKSVAAYVSQKGSDLNRESNSKKTDKNKNKFSPSEKEKTSDDGEEDDNNESQEEGVKKDDDKSESEDEEEASDENNEDDDEDNNDDDASEGQSTSEESDQE